MKFNVSIDWQEDENSPTGTMYYVSVADPKDDWQMPILETKYHTMSVAWGDALGEMQAKGLV